MSQPALTPQNAFSYDRDTFFVNVGGHNLHRRATIFEIQETLHPTGPQTGKDPVGHWYEAQCVHYGLPPSKTKSVAKTRLLDALNAKTLEVPKAVRAIEEKLRKEWHKGQREKLVKNTTKDSKKNATSPLGSEPVRKRKAAAAEGLEKDGRKLKKAAPLKNESVKLKLPTTSEGPARAALPRKQTARRGRGGTALGRGKITATPNAQESPVGDNNRPTRPIQTARSSRGTGRVSAPSRGKAGHSKLDDAEEVEEGEDSDAPPPYEAMAPPLPGNQLGPLNGDYLITCPSLQHEWAEYDDFQFTLSLALQGSVVWGAYDFGMFSGSLRIAQRPREASDRPCALTWRGIENGEGEISLDDRRQKGWIKFLDDGRISGNLRGMYEDDHLFEGVRVAESTGRSAASLKGEWDAFSNGTYEMVRGGRWQ